MSGYKCLSFPNKKLAFLFKTIFCDEHILNLNAMDPLDCFT